MVLSKAWSRRSKKTLVASPPSYRIKKSISRTITSREIQPRTTQFRSRKNSTRRVLMKSRLVWRTSRIRWAISTSRSASHNHFIRWYETKLKEES
jgi:hypothetical protein